MLILCPVENCLNGQISRNRRYWENLDSRKNFDHLQMNKFLIIQGVLLSLLDMYTITRKKELECDQPASSRNDEANLFGHATSFLR